MQSARPNKLSFFSNYILDLLNNNPLEKAINTSPKKRKRFLYAVFAFIIIWQSICYIAPIKIDPSYRRADATGFNHWWGQEFAYFYYYKGLFPLATTYSNKVFSGKGAEEIITNKPSSLRMEWGHWSRFGESARIWLYMPYCHLTGSAKNPQIIFFNFLFFTCSLLALFYVFWRKNFSALGLIMIIIIGSSPFMAYEVYNNNNIFGLLASYAIVQLALYIPLFEGNHNNRHFIIPVISGILAGIMYHIRAESMAVFISCVTFVWLNNNINLLRKTLHTILLLSLLILTVNSIKKYFETTQATTRKVVADSGGAVFEGGKTIVHPFWHPIYCGLGDFDTKYGHVLHDTAVYNYALPILRIQTGDSLRYPGRTKYEMAEYYDKDSLYYKKVETIPGYDKLIKEKFISDIIDDPLWYTGIITKRIVKFLFNLSPLGISIYKYAIPIPFHGIIFLLLLTLLLAKRQWFWVKILVFTMPLGISVIAIFYCDNNSYQSVFHMFAAAIIIYILAGYVYLKRKKTTL